MASMMRCGSSERGLSLVITTRSAIALAISPIIGRLPGSRSPPQPNTHTRRPRRLCTVPRKASSTLARASGECA
jgi:hypothetical protein